MKSVVLAIAFVLVMFTAFCESSPRMGGGCDYYGSCWKWCGTEHEESSTFGNLTMKILHNFVNFV